MVLTQSEQARLFREMSSLLHAGILPDEGAAILAREEEGAVSAVLDSMAEGLSAGKCLSEVLEGSVPGWCAALVTVGEQTGRLEEALAYLAEFCDAQVRSRRLLKQSVAYPAMLFALMLTVVGLLLTKVLPIFDRVYASLGTGLTGLGAGLLKLGAGLEEMFPLLLAMILAALAAVCVLRWVPSAGNWAERTFWNHFGHRGFLKKFHNARFARALAMAVASGMEGEEALALAGALLADIPDAVKRCAEAEKILASTGDLSRALEEAELMSAPCCRMLAVGLRGGNADGILADIARRMEEEARQSVEDLLARAEPAMVLVSAALVGMILLSVMVPLLDLLTVLG